MPAIRPFVFVVYDIELLQVCTVNSVCPSGNIRVLVYLPSRYFSPMCVIDEGTPDDGQPIPGVCYRE